MTLRKIDKLEYKQRLSRIQWVLVAALFAISLSLAELYRYLLVGGESNAWLNAAGVLTAALLCSLVLYLGRNHSCMSDIVYIWRLKQALNKIYRRSKKIDAGIAKDQPDAIRIRYFSLHASAYVYQLEDNTLTMPELNEQIDELNQQISRLGMMVSIDDYNSELLEQL
ncbi:MAG: DUF3087 family protein [Oleibacter sp.]|nr:DUF3087 family protein [Thalassolituus sp.]